MFNSSVTNYQRVCVYVDSMDDLEVFSHDISDIFMDDYDLTYQWSHWM